MDVCIKQLKQCTFGELNSGDVFGLNSGYFIKIHAVEDYYAAVNLFTGEEVRLIDLVSVYPFEQAVVDIFGGKV